MVAQAEATAPCRIWVRITARLRSLGKDQCSVRLDWQKRGQLTLTHRDANGHSATMQVPVEIHGNPPVIAFNARYLADALELGSTLCPEPFHLKEV